uniref:hypothetical protein n=1 Tax=Thiolapillus sp. TaxID=2017437 RepID=UPI003AF94C89
STTQQLRKLVAAPYLSPNDWTPRLDAYFASPLALCARRVSSAASRLLGSTSLRFALHGWQRMMQLYQDFSGQIGHSGNPSQYRKYLPAYPSAPSPSLSQGQVPDGSLDGAWASQNRILLAIKQQYARMYWARDQYRDFYLEGNYSPLSA